MPKTDRYPQDATLDATDLIFGTDSAGKQKNYAGSVFIGLITAAYNALLAIINASKTTIKFVLQNNSVSQGEIGWNLDEDTLDVGMANGVVNQVGMENFVYVQNSTSSQINDGHVVKYAGSIGNSGRANTSLYQAVAGVSDYYMFGIATQNIAVGQKGKVTVFGRVRNASVTIPVGETWNNGDILYASATTAGGLTKVAPIAPLPKTPVCILIAKSGSNCTFFVTPKHGCNIDELHNVYVSSLQNKQVLEYNTANGRWQNGTPISEASGSWTPEVNVENFTDATDVSGTYYRVGNMVHIIGELFFLEGGIGAGLSVSGLPFNTSGTGLSCISIGKYLSSENVSVESLMGTVYSDTITFYVEDPDYKTSKNVEFLDSGTRIRFSATYITA